MAEIVAVSAAQLLHDSAQLEAVARVFAAAFRTDPGMRYICGQDEARLDQHLLAYFRGSLPIYAHPLWMLQTDGRYIGGAVLSRSDHTLNWKLGLRAVWIFVTQGNFGLMNRAISYGKRLEPYYPDKPHLTLEYLAVLPEAQGQGYGRQLLEKVAQVAQATPNNTGVWLESPAPENVPLYERFGYENLTRITISGDVGTTIMFRPQPESS